MNSREPKLEIKDNPREDARYYFFQFIPRDVLEELEPLYRSFSNILNEQYRDYGSIESDTDFLRIPSWRRTLESWAKVHYIAADWVYEKVLAMFWDRYLAVHVEVREGIIIPLKHIEGLDQTNRPPKGLESYLPGLDSREGYLEKCRSKLSSLITKHALLSLAGKPQRRRFIDSILVEIEDYCNRVEKYYESLPDWQLRKQAAIRGRNAKWAVKYQVEGKSYSDIEAESDQPVSTIKRAVDKTLLLIGLDRRPVSRGPKPGSKNSYSARILQGLGK